MICPACQSVELEVFLEIDGQPALCNVLHHSRESARSAPRGDIHLSVCPVCAMIFNAAFDPRALRYTAEYENSLHASPTFHSHATRLAESLVARHALSGGTVVDVGCGRGDFLALLKQAGVRRCLGFDPGLDADAAAALSREKGVTITADAFAPGMVDEAINLLTCRHVLEHIERPRQFVSLLRDSIGNDRSAVFIEVPDGEYMLREAAVWDVLYEHCGYFTDVSLGALLSREGLTPTRTECIFAGQFLAIEATRPSFAPSAEPDRARVHDIVDLSRRFASVYRERIDSWRARLDLLRRRGGAAAVWGAGTKGVMFLNALGEISAVIRSVVDLNPRKQGCFVSGAGAPIVSPESLRSDPPQLVIVMNPNYGPEITGQLASLGVRADVEVA